VAPKRQVNPSRAAIRKRAQRAHPKMTACERCGTANKLSRHHPDYSKPEQIVVLCLTCHTTMEWEAGKYAERPSPVIVRDPVNGRILRTLPNSTPAPTDPATPRWATRSRSTSPSGSGGG
jgi:hypothetical protein